MSTEREKKASVALASNLPLPYEWGHIIPDPRLVAVIVHRVTSNATIVDAERKSPWLRTRPGTFCAPSSQVPAAI
ncbi:MAG: hypothetical protein ACLQVK_14985 [Acidimicrobiales bacterium]